MSMRATTHVAIPTKKVVPQRHWSLRVHLLLSYILLLSVALVVMGLTLMVGLVVQPAPPQTSYKSFAALIQGLDGNIIEREFKGRPRGPNRVGITSLLSEFAQSRDTRILWIEATGPNLAIVHYDTAGLFADESSIYISRDSYMSPTLQLNMPMPFRQIYGSFRNTDQTEWLFGGLMREVNVREINARDGNTRQYLFQNMFVMAEPRPTVSLQESLNEFSTALLPPLLQAGCVGLIVALGMAFVMTRTLARPLQALAQGAGAVASGDYKHRVAEIGPSEMRAVAGAFNDMGRQVRESQQSQRDFLANVSHDLKTPLTSIQGYAQAVIDGATRDPKAAAQIIYDESARLNRLVLELTDLMRMQSGRFSLHMQPLDVSEIVAAIGQRLTVVAERKDVRLKVSTPPLPSVTGDGDRLAQVLTNLLSNAIHFTPKGGTVTVETQINQGGVEIRVQDTGIGISAAELPRIFERFYQVDKARGPGREGSGLGLAITKQIVLAHGGYIRVESPGPNQGTTFTVWLPSPEMSTMITRRKN